MKPLGSFLARTLFNRGSLAAETSPQSPRRPKADAGGRIYQPVRSLSGAAVETAPAKAGPRPVNVLPTIRAKGGIYIASKTTHAARWRLLRDRHGVKIISTWIDEAGVGQSASLSELSSRCIEEATRCERFVLFCDDGEILRGALLECGAAMASGVHVYCVGQGPSISRVFEQHPLWHRCERLEDALGLDGIPRELAGAHRWALA